MFVEHLLAVVPVADLDRSRQWYERLFGRAPDNTPMDTLVEWRVTGTGWLQVFSGTDGAGTGYANLAVEDLESTRDELEGRGLEPGSIQEVDKGVRLFTLRDPDGNTISLIGGFRIVY